MEVLNSHPEWLEFVSLWELLTSQSHEVMFQCGETQSLLTTI